MNTIALPACPRGNSASFKIILKDYGDSLVGAEFAFIASKDLSGRTCPPVHLRWCYQVPEPGFQVNPLSIEIDVEDDDCDECEEECRHVLFTYLVIPSWVTARLHPGPYFFNIDIRFPFREHYIKTILSGTWPILAVPGLMFDRCHLSLGTQWSTPGPIWDCCSHPGWQPQLMDQFPPHIPRRSYAY